MNQDTYNIYLLNNFVRDLAQQRLNAHAQTPRGRPLTVTGKGHHQRNNDQSIVASAAWLKLKDDKICCRACYQVTFDQSYLFFSSWSHGSGSLGASPF